MPAPSQNIVKTRLPFSAVMQPTFSISVSEQPIDISLEFALVPERYFLNILGSTPCSNPRKQHGYMIRVIFPQYTLTSQMGTCTWRLQNIMTSKSSSLIKYIILRNTLFFLAKRENIWNFGQGRMVTDYEIVRCSQFNKDSRTIR